MRGRQQCRGWGVKRTTGRQQQNRHAHARRARIARHLLEEDGDEAVASRRCLLTHLSSACSQIRKAKEKSVKRFHPEQACSNASDRSLPIFKCPTHINPINAAWRDTRSLGLLFSSLFTYTLIFWGGKLFCMVHADHDMPIMFPPSPPNWHTVYPAHK